MVSTLQVNADGKKGKRTLEDNRSFFRLDESTTAERHTINHNVWRQFLPVCRQDTDLDPVECRVCIASQYLTTIISNWCLQRTNDGDRSGALRCFAGLAALAGDVEANSATVDLDLHVLLVDQATNYGTGAACG